MTNRQLKNLGYLIQDFSIRDVANMLENTFDDCEKCQLYSRCPIMIETKEMKETGWWSETVNSCRGVLAGYLTDGNIHDKRKENKE